MRNILSAVTVLALVLFSLASLGGRLSTQPATTRTLPYTQPATARTLPSTQPTTARAQPVSKAELLAELKDAPGRAGKRAGKLIHLFRQAGLKDVKKQRIPMTRGRYNVVATLPGKSKEVIIVGAHVDCSRSGRGIIDDWSGASMMTNLAQALSGTPRRHTFVFIGFDLEESGLIGSRHYVSRISEKQKHRIRAMVNLECLGVSGLKVWLTGSADALEVIAAKVAKTESFAVRMRQLRGVGADSDSFMAVGIPAITFDSLDEKDFNLIDSPKDQFEAINAGNFNRQYRFLLKYLLALDAHKGRITAANKDRPPPPAHIGFTPEPEAFEQEKALIVKSVWPGGAEDKAGMEKGDLILEFGGTVLKSPTDILGRIRVLKRGDKITVKIKRDNKVHTLIVQY